MAIDFTKLLQGDTTLQDALRAISEQGNLNKTVLQGGVQSPLVRFGRIPENLPGQYTPFVDQFTRDLAAQATNSGVSTWAQMQHNADLQRMRTLNSVAARGFRSYGGLAPHLAEDARANNLNQFNAYQNLLGELGGQYNTYLNSQAEGRQQASQATESALNRIIAQINAGIISDTTPAQKAAAPIVQPRQGAQSGSVLATQPSDHPLGNFVNRTPRLPQLPFRNRYADVGAY